MGVETLRGLFEKVMSSQDGQFAPDIVDDAKALLNEALDSECPEERLFDVLQSNRRGRNRTVDACASRIVTEYFVDCNRLALKNQSRQPV